MANIFMSLVCPLDGQEYELTDTPLADWLVPSPFDGSVWSDQIGGGADTWFDTTTRCPTNHGWAVNFRVAIQRTA